MIRKSRLLRWFGAILALFLFVGYFAFSTFVFDPFEAGLGVDISGLVPREVDFFFARARLDDVFDGFPTLAVEDELEPLPAWQAWMDSPEREELLKATGYREIVTRIQEATADLPLGLEPLDIFGGRDLAVAGFFHGAGVEKMKWAVYGTLSTPGKLAIEALKYPGLLPLAEQGIDIAVDERYVTLTGSALKEPILVSRVRDVGILSNSPELVNEAHDQDAKQFEGSFLAGPDFNDHIQRVDRNDRRDELEFHVQTRGLMEMLQVSGAWPDKNSQDFLPSLGAKLFQLNTINQVSGVIGIDDGITVDVHGKLSSELMTPLQTRIYGRRAISGEELIRDFAQFAPSDTSLFVFFKCDIGDLLTQVFDSIEPDMRRLIEERFQQSGKYRNLAQLIEEVDAALLDRVVLIVRDHDYPVDPLGPPHDGAPVPAVAVVTWPAKGGKEKIEALRDVIGAMGSRIGLAGRESGESGYYRNSVGGKEIREFWCPNIAGTGMIANLTSADICITANSHPMLDHIHKTWTQGQATGFPRLSERSDFVAVARSAGNGANLAAWFNPRTLASTLRKQARLRASDSIVIDWTFERARVEDLVLRESFGGRKATALGPAESADFDRLVDQKLEVVRTNIFDKQVPILMAEYERDITYSELIQGGLLMLAVQPKQFELALRVIAPL